MGSDIFSEPATMEHVSAASDDVQPIPPRYWWLKRIGVSIVILLIALGLLRWWWGVKAHRALQAEIDRLVATGQPVFAEDFRPAPVPDDQNAVIPLKQAAAALSLTKTEQQLLGRIRSDAKEFYGNVGEVQEILTRTVSSRVLVRESRRRSGANWGWYPRGLRSSPPSMLPYSDLLAILGAAALDAHSRGDDAEVVEILRDMLACGRCFQSMSILLASLLDCRAANQVAVILAASGPEMRVERSSDGFVNDGRPATRRQLEDLVVDLMIDQESREGFQRSFYADRPLSLDVIKTVTGGGYSISLGPATDPWKRSVSFMLKPMFELDGLKMLRYTTMVAQAAGAQNYPAATRCYPNFPPAEYFRGLKGRAHMLTRIYTPDFGQSVSSSFDTITRRRMAAVAMTIRLYQLDNARLPDKLNDLVPRYLPAIPQDPFADDGRGIGYRLTADPPVLCSVRPPEITFPLRSKRPATAPARSQTQPVSR
jgi:hypothetical protein